MTRPCELSIRPTTAQLTGILIVDDEPVLRHMLGVFLAPLGFQVWCARCGHEALAVYQEHPEIRLVLTDVVMPGGDGSFLLTALQSMTPDVPVCFLSGSFGCYGSQELMQRGAAAVFSKPCELSDLAATLLRLAGMPVE